MQWSKRSLSGSDCCVQNITSNHAGESGHQTVTEFIKLKTPEQTIHGFTDQKVSGRAGLLTFAGFLHWHRFGTLLARV